MERKEIEEKVKAFLIDELEVDEDKIAPEALLKEDIGIDSLDFVDIVVIVERTFGFKIKPEEMGGVKTLSDFCDYIQSKVGDKYGLGYMDIFGQGYYAPLVELSFKYKSPIIYGMPCRIDIHYRPTEAAKIVFDYEIRNAETDELLATGHSVQVFMDKEYRLVWITPEFYARWKERWNMN